MFLWGVFMFVVPNRHRAFNLGIAFINQTGMVGGGGRVLKMIFYTQ